MDFDEGMHAFADVQLLSELSPHGSLPNPRTVLAVLLFNAGQARRRVGAFDDASSLYAASQHTLDDEEEDKSLSPVSVASAVVSPLKLQPIIVPILHNIGQLQYRRGRIQEAIDTYSETLRCARIIHGEDHTTVAAALNSLGVLHYHSSSDESDEAMALFQDALRIRVNSLGLNHPDVATTLNNIGRIHVQRDEFDEALQYYEDALRIRGARLGTDSLDYAATAFNAGQSLHQKGEYDRALYLYHEFLRVALVKFTKNHRDVAVVLSGIAQIHQEKKEYDKALELYEESLQAGKAAL
eukprot:6130057-Ditylum_brightwellii.AAC.2